MNPWGLDPIAFHLGPLTVYWYGIAYVVAFLLAWSYALWLAQRHQSSVPRAVIDKCFGIPSLVGIVLGGRLGHVLFYSASYYLAHPLEILMTWRGGMSFHGGLVGVLVALYWLSRQWKSLSYLAVLDLLAVVAPIGLGLGRLANFINGELFGTVSTLPWAMVFPTGGTLPRHPSQLYEALLEGIFLLFLLNILWRKTSLRYTPGRLTGVGLMGYGFIRFMVEFVRDNPPATLENIPLSTGQWLSIPMIALGLYLFYRPRPISQHLS